MPVTETSRNEKVRGKGIEARRFVRANASAVVATVLEWGLVTALVAFGVHYLVAAAVGALAGAVIDFSIKRHWAFIRGNVGGVHHEALRYVMASGLSLGLNVLAAYLLVERLHMAKIPGVILASFAVGTLWNYPIHRFFVFPVRAAPNAAAVS
ncbi:MAG: GtrA family protein [Gemmatimonadota bacterium]|nr:GtrA family protein [Gemmatimonadota bacterium]